MHSSLSCALLCLPTLVLSSPTVLSQLNGAHSLTPPNANYIFNAIHSSLRQWGSSLNHNGLSYFVASVSEGTQFYHGRGNPEPVIGMEWLAFEPEHAMLFAWNVTGRPPRPPGRKPGEGHSRDARMLLSPSSEIATQYRKLRRHLRTQNPDAPVPFGHDDDVKMEPGYLHTYTTRRPLRLLYVDGMSAGKTDKGTLDSQDYILLNSSGPQPGFWDYERAKGMCDLAETEWKGRIDGILRMESGFEVIMCDFSKNLHVERVTRTSPVDPRGEPGMVRDEEEFFAYYQAVATRYHGLGKERAVLDYEHFVTAYIYDLDLFRQGDMPRLENLSANKTFDKIRSDIKDMTTSDATPAASFDWQAVTDKIVLRYSSRLRNLISPTLSTSKHLSEELNRILQPFIDYDVRNSTAEIARCTTQFTPSSTSQSLASNVITSISHTICATLSSALETSTEGEKGYENARQSISELISYLKWTTWKDCRGCGDDEICFVPMWPAGSVQDYENPQCTNASGLMERRGYWGHPSLCYYDKKEQRKRWYVWDERGKMRQE